MTWTLLERVDPDEGLNRWSLAPRSAALAQCCAGDYVGVQPGLFDQIVVVRFWGSRESAFQQMALQASQWVLTYRRRGDGGRRC